MVLLRFQKYLQYNFINLLCIFIFIALGLEDYKELIKKPMDLNTVRRNLNKD